MNRNVRCVMGLLIFGVAAAVAVLWPAATTVEPLERERAAICFVAHGCVAVGSGADFALSDFTNLFVAAGVALVGLALLISCVFGVDHEGELP